SCATCATRSPMRSAKRRLWSFVPTTGKLRQSCQPTARARKSSTSSGFPVSNTPATAIPESRGKTMRILFITQYFAPETEIGGIRILEIAARLDSMGHEIVILTGLPNYPSGRLFDGYRRKAWRGTWTEKINGLNVTRVPLFPSHDKQTLPRLLN